MKNIFKYLLVVASLVVYMVSIVGIGVHVCGDTGKTVTSLAYGDLDCKPIHCSGCNEGHCHTEIFSLSDDAEVPSFAMVFHQVMETTVHTVVVYLSELYADVVRKDFFGFRDLRLLPDRVPIGALTVMRI